MKKISLDPRVNRLTLEEAEDMDPLRKGEMWPTYEVFKQEKRGKQHIHTGIVHAPNAPMAMVFAKEQFGRRGTCTNIWVIPSSEIYASDYEDADVFDTTPEKLHREPGFYKVKEKLKKIKNQEKTGDNE
jgi:ring-1,2-phenylacetyl-CoA epoxidase subunit PaaB